MGNEKDSAHMRISSIQSQYRNEQMKSMSVNQGIRTSVETDLPVETGSKTISHLEYMTKSEVHVIYPGSERK
jgi:hypothetical protein